MKTKTHKEFQYMLLADPARLEGSDLSDLNAHLPECEECHAFAELISQLKPEVQRHLHERWDPILPSRRFTEGIMQTHRRKKMVVKLSSISRSLAWLVLLALMVALLVWAIPVLVFKQPLFPKIVPQFLMEILGPPPTAEELNLQPQDLGSSWTLAVEKTEFSPKMYWDVDEQGMPIFGEHDYTSSPFMPEDIESFDVRGFAHPDRNSVIFTSVIVFKDAAQAKKVTEDLFPMIDSDTPEENRIIEVLNVGEDGTRVHFSAETADGKIPYAATVGFLKGRVGFLLSILNIHGGGIPLSQEQLVGLAGKVEARIPGGY